VPGSWKARAPGKRVLGTQFPGLISMPSLTQHPFRAQRSWASETDVHVRVADPMGPTATRPSWGWGLAIAAGAMVEMLASRMPASNPGRVVMGYHEKQLSKNSIFYIFCQD